MHKKREFFLGLSVMLLLACRFIGGVDQLPENQLAETATMMLSVTEDIHVATLLPVEQSTATIVVTENPVDKAVLEEIAGVVSVSSINLRSGPSKLHRVVESYKEGTSFTAVGRAVGSEWLKVEMPDQHYGWMYAPFLEIANDAMLLPLVEVQDSIIMEGRMVDTDLQPVEGIVVAFFWEGAPQNERAECVSGQDGHFFAYLPEGMEGKWLASVVSVRCDSNIVDANCNYEGRFEPQLFNLMLVPIGAVFEFTYFEE